MKTNCFINSVVVAVGLVAFSAAGCAQKEQTADASPPPAKDSAPTVVTTTLPGATPTAQVAAATSPDVAIAQWIDIKDCTYDMRPKFFSGLKRLEARVDEHISKLSIRRAAMKSTANTQDWDFAMKEMGNARSSLVSSGDELRKASPETWAQEKEKVGQAWLRAQNAYDKVKSSTTD
jgi:hypothetical protein